MILGLRGNDTVLYRERALYFAKGWTFEMIFHVYIGDQLIIIIYATILAKNVKAKQKIGVLIEQEVLSSIMPKLESSSKGLKLS